MTTKTTVSKKTPVSQFFTTFNASRKSPNFKKLLNVWLESCTSSGLSPRTTYDYSDKVCRFVWWWENKGYSESLGDNPSAVTQKEAKEFVAYLRQPTKDRWGNSTVREKLSPKSVEDYGHALRVFFNFLENEGYIEASPLNKSVKFGTPKNRRNKTIKSIVPQDIAFIFSALTSEAQMQTFAGVRDLAMFSLLLDSGIRRGELLSLETSDLDMAGLRCTVEGKTGRRTAYFSERCKGLLLDYLRKREAENFEEKEAALWVTVEGIRLGDDSFQSIVRRLEKRSGVKFHVHQMRHTFALMMSKKVSVFELKDMMGHSSISTTQIYVENNPNTLSASHSGVSPLNTLEGHLPGLRRKGRPRKYT